MDKVEMEHDSEVSSITNSSQKPKVQVQIVFSAADLEFSATLATKLYRKSFISALLGQVQNQNPGLDYGLDYGLNFGLSY